MNTGPRNQRLGPRLWIPGPGPNLTASVIGNSCYLADRRIATGASRQGPGEGDNEAPTHCADRVGNMPFGSDRRRLWVDNPREWQIARAAWRNLVLRGEGRLARRSGSRMRRYRGWPNGASRNDGAAMEERMAAVIERQRIDVRPTG